MSSIMVWQPINTSVHRGVQLAREQQLYVALKGRASHNDRGLEGREAGQRAGRARSGGGQHQGLIEGAISVCNRGSTQRHGLTR